MESILSFVGGETVNCTVARVNFNLGTYCKGAVGKKSDKILSGSPFPDSALRECGEAIRLL